MDVTSPRFDSALRVVRTVLAVLGVFTLAACSADATRTGVCDPGAAELCGCPGGESGVRICQPNGSEGACLCGEDIPDGVSIDVGDFETTDTGAADTTPDVIRNDVVAPCESFLLWPDEDGDGHGDVNADPVESCEYLLGFVTTSTDCDDTDRQIFPTAPELCDEVDNDCDTIVDEQATAIDQWPDTDDDGYGDPDGIAISTCEAQPGYATNDDDCDDADGEIYPNTTDLCDGVDNDCDDDVDEDAAYRVFYPDADEDGFGDADAAPISRCAAPEGMVENRDDCDDSTDEVGPHADEICNLSDDDCDGVLDEGVGLMLLWPDEDGDTYGDSFTRPIYSCEAVDGFVDNGDDCDDLLFTVNPLGVERCNGRDDDCNGLDDDDATDQGTWYPDADGDGYGVTTGPVSACGRPANHSDVAGDCDDRFDTVNPGAAEVCDGSDNNCDRVIDEGVVNACGGCGPTPAESCGNLLDDDCDGSIDEAAAGCFCDGRTNQPCYAGPPETLGIGLCRGGTMDCACPGGARFCTDGTWGACGGQVLPAAELCDNLDNDCDGRVDEGLRNACGACGGDVPEICDGEDNDCDGAVDEFVRLTCGVCAGDAGVEQCDNGLDDDCDGFVDEECRCTEADVACYPGPPATRGVGACQDGLRECYATAETAAACVGAVVPSIEICDDIDNDCDGAVDESSNGCSICGTSPEICDGSDNDCDGFVDEQLRNGCGDCLADVAPEEAGGLGLCDGSDNDCDGLVDEGLMNACGNCDEACYTDGWDTDGEFESGGDGDGIVAEDGLRLNTTSFNFSDLWVANTYDDTVTRINTNSGTVIGTYPVGLNAGINNDNPSRTAVDLNGDAWVANRANSAGGLQASVTKIRGGDCVTDCVEFTVPIGGPGGVARALAVDAENHVWVGNFGERRIYRLNNTTGAIMEQYDIPIATYGFAIDREGIIWVAAQSATDGIGAFDTNTNTWLGNWALGRCARSYGIAVDGGGNVWFGTWTCNSMARLDRAAWEETPRRIVFNEYGADGTFTNTRGVAIDGAGQVWLAASGTNRLGRFDLSGNLLGSYATCSTPVGVGVASDGNIWSVCQGTDEAQRWSPTGGPLGNVPVGDVPYSYSDMTGFQLRAFTAPAGNWVQSFDCGFAGCGVEAIRWSATVPAGTTLSVDARSREAGGTWSAWTTPYTSSPADTSSALPPGQFVEVRVRLTTTEDELTPVVRSLEVDWQRP